MEEGLIFYFGLDVITLALVIMYMKLFYKIVQVNGFKNAYIVTQVFLLISSLMIGVLRYSVRIYNKLLDDEHYDEKKMGLLPWYLGNFQ